MRSSPVLARFIDAILRRRNASLALLALFVVTALLGVLRLEVELSSTAFYGDGDAAAARLRTFQDRWGADDDALLVLVRPADPGDTAGVLRDERLAAIAKLSEALSDHPDVREVSSIASLELPLPAPASGSTSFATLARGLGLADQSPDARASVLEPLPFVPTLLSTTGKDTAIVARLRFSSDDVVRTRAALVELEVLLAEHDPHLEQLGLTRELAGIPAIRAGFLALLIHDQSIFVPLTLAIIGLAMLALFRRLHGVLIPAIAAGVPTAALVGVMGWTGEPVGLLNQALFTLLPVIAVADAIHMVTRFHEEVRKRAPGADADQRRATIVAACSHVGLACLLTSLTTGAGFASLALAKMPILRGFGLYAALGVGLAFVMEIALVPLLLSFVEPERVPPKTPGGLKWIDGCVALALRRPALVVLASLALMGAALIPARSVTIDNRLSDLIDPDHPASQASARVDAELGGVLGLELELSSPSEDLRDPELLTALHTFEGWLGAQAQVRSVEGLAGAVAAAGLVTGGAREVPANRAEIDARLEAIAPYAPLERLVRDQGRQLRIHAGMPDAGGAGFVEFAEAAEAELRARVAETELGPGVEVHATGTALLAYRGVNGITADLRTSFLLIFAVVVLVIALLFRSPWPAVIALLPNFAPLLLGYALLGLLGEVLDPLAAVILTLALGIAVDDTIHVMVRTREELGHGLALDEALAAALHHTGLAVALTSVVIVGGLLLDLGASFPPLRLLGLLGSTVIALALLANLILLPALIRLLGGRGLSGSS